MLAVDEAKAAQNRSAHAIASLEGHIVGFFQRLLITPIRNIRNN